MKRLLLATALVALAAAPALAGSGAHYAVTFGGTWSAATHPQDYPGNAHFSGLVGATHNGAYDIFKQGGTATPGLEKLSGMGAHHPLDDEIRAAIQAGKAGELFEGKPIFGPPGQATAAFDIDEKFPMVSVVALVAPSSDRRASPCRRRSVTATGATLQPSGARPRSLTSAGSGSAASEPGCCGARRTSIL